MVCEVCVRSRKAERECVLMDCAVKRFVLMFKSLRRCDRSRSGGQTGVCSLRLGALSPSCQNAESCVEIEVGHRESEETGLSMDRDGSLGSL